MWVIDTCVSTAISILFDSLQKFAKIFWFTLRRGSTKVRLIFDSLPLLQYKLSEIVLINQFRPLLLKGEKRAKFNSTHVLFFFSARVSHRRELICEMKRKIIKQNMTKKKRKSHEKWFNMGDEWSVRRWKTLNRYRQQWRWLKSVINWGGTSVCQHTHTHTETVGKGWTK